MSIADKLQTIAENEQRVFEAGEQAEYDRFWDNYQHNGNRTHYACAFADYGWTDETFNPKYKMIPSDVYMMFRYTNITKDISDYVDFSQCTGGGYTFYASSLKSIQADFSSATNLLSTFGYTEKNETISIKLSNAGVKLTDCFTSMKGLKNLTIEGVISEGNINVSSSTLLTVESAKSLITALKDLSGTDKAYTYKVTFSAATKDLLDTEGATAPNGDTWLNYAFSKGWNR